MSAPATTTTTPTTPETPARATEPSAEDVLRFDPFQEDASEEGEPPAEPEAEAPAEPPKADPPAVPVAPAAAAPTAPSPTADEILALNRQLLEQNRMLSERLAGTPAPKKEEPKEDPIPAYAFNLPKEIEDAWNSEDPATRMGALRAVLSASLQTAHRQLRNEYRQFVERQSEQMVGSLTQRNAAAERNKSIFNDFYGKFPTLNQPELRSLVATVTQQVEAETGAKAWSPELRDKIGERVFSVLKRVAPGTSGSEPPKSTTSAPPKMRGATARPAGVVPAAGDEDPQTRALADILDISGYTPKMRG